MNALLISEAVDLVDEAALLPPHARDAFYTDRCHERDELLALVRRIEAAPGDSRAPMLGDSLEELTPLLFADPEADCPDPMIGVMVDEYLVEAKIGEGGMGCVYRALYTRHHALVALKVLQTTGAGDGHHRLKREVELLERCSHPAIVRARHSGLLPDGRSYFTMDLVEGQSITSFCSSTNATLEQRLRLFVGVCEGVQAAHAVGVIHRDLKPSNILVAEPASPNDAPAVRLLDFGIAEAFGDSDLAVRSYIAVAYAAPEHDRATSPQTDVYSLGILLAEMVLGRLPFDLSERRASALRRSILAQGVQPLRAFAAEEPQWWLARLSRLEWRELQAICGRATARLPEDRYGTVRELAEDARRFVARRPVEALELSRKRRALYQGWRLVARNRGAAAVAALMLVLLGGAVAGYAWGLRQSRNAALQARNAALETAAHADKMQQLAAGLFLDGDGPVSAKLTAEQLLDRGMESAKALNSEPEEQAEFLLTLGQAYQGFGRFATAEAAFSQSLAIRTRMHGAESLEAAETMSQQADLLGAEGKLQEGLRLAERALGIQRRMLGSGEKAVLQSQTQIAQLWTELGDREKAVPILEEVIRRETGRPELLNDRSNAINDLSIIENDLGHTKRSLDLQEQTLAIDRQLEGPRHPDIGMHLITLSTGHVTLGQYALADAEAREAISILKEKLTPGHHDIAAAEYHLGIALMFEARWREAEAVVNEALRTLTAEPVRSRSEATALWALGEIYEGEGKLAEAMATYQRDLAEYKQLYPSPHQQWTSPLRGIASVELKQHHATEAERAARLAYDICRAQLPLDDKKTVQSEVLFGRALTALHRFTEAAPLLEEAARLTGNQSTNEVRQEAAQALAELHAAEARRPGR